MMHSHWNVLNDKDFKLFVLILVVMDDALAPWKRRSLVLTLWVLILVVMDDALALGSKIQKAVKAKS